MTAVLITACFLSSYSRGRDRLITFKWNGGDQKRTHPHISLKWPSPISYVILPTAVSLGFPFNSHLTFLYWCSTATNLDSQSQNESAIHQLCKLWSLNSENILFSLKEHGCCPPWLTVAKTHSGLHVLEHGDSTAGGYMRLKCGFAGCLLQNYQCSQWSEYDNLLACWSEDYTT